VSGGLTSWSDLHAEVAVRLSHWPPYALVAAVESALRTVDEAAVCLLYLVDYRFTELRPAEGRSRRVYRVEGSEPGRCLLSQQVLACTGESGALFVPVTARGDRLGVLEVRAPGLAGLAAAADGLTEVATLLAHAVLVADQVTDAYRIARRERPLTLAAEMQWDALPGRSLDAGYARVAAQLEPAYTVVGDAYDWVADPSGLSGLLVDGAGYGTRAAGNAVFTISAVRNARRQGADLAAMAGAADEALRERHGGELFCSAVLFDLEPISGTVQLVVAGAGVVVLAGRRSARRLLTTAQPALGVGSGHRYVGESYPLRPGERLVVASDGLVDAQVDGVLFGDGLENLVQGCRLLGAADLVRRVIDDLSGFHAGHPLQDDAVVMCLDLPRQQVTDEVSAAEPAGRPAGSGRPT
jgi:serine phosphatase RsbU (regulator of sigma subunit)